jgi:hypothetical protein
MAPYYLISDVYDGKFKYYRTPRVFAVEIRKYHQNNPLKKFYEIEQLSFIDLERGGFGEILPSVMIFPEGLHRIPRAEGL